MKKDLTQGSIGGNIFSFSLPYMLAYFLQVLYGLADLAIIGLYCGVDSTTAVSNGAQIMYMVTVIVIGLAMGATVRIGRAMGANDSRQISQIIGNTFTFFLLLAMVLSIVLLCLRNDIVQVIDTPAEALAETTQYLTICFIGIPFVVAYNIIASIFRGMGDSKNPMYFVAVACVVNILLDYLFIGRMQMGATGAALATILSQMTSVVIALLAIRGHENLLKVSRKDFKLQRGVIAGILKIGVPVSLQDGFIQVAFMAITVIANGRGLNDAAAVGIVEKIIGLLFIVPSAMLSTVSAISAQCIGAGEWMRARKTLRYAMLVTIGFGFIVSVLFQFIPEQAIRLFTDDSQVITLGGEYLKSYVIDCLFAGIHFCYSGFFTACGYSVISFCHNMFSITCFRIPLSYCLSEMFPHTLYPMGFASPAGSLASAIVCIVVYAWMRRHHKFMRQA